QHTAAVDILEVAVRELVPGLALPGHLVVDSEMPPCVFADPVSLDELVLPLGRGLMFAPFVPVVENVAAILDQLPGIPVRGLVQRNRHGPNSALQVGDTGSPAPDEFTARSATTPVTPGLGAPVARVSYSLSASRTRRGSPC